MTCNFSMIRLMWISFFFFQKNCGLALISSFLIAFRSYKHSLSGGSSLAILSHLCPTDILIHVIGQLIKLQCNQDTKDT